MEITNNWFNESAKHNWDHIISAVKPSKILEIGSYEGASLCFLIDKLKEQDLEIHAIDSWAGGSDQISKQVLADNPMDAVEKRFHSNMDEAISKHPGKVDLKVYKSLSYLGLSKLISEGFSNYFDFIYIDGSHETSDTLSDCVMAFHLLKKTGIMCIDDYLWQVDTGATHRPKLAIDAFSNINHYSLDIIATMNTQVFLVKK